MTKEGEVRDWNKDMERVESFKYAKTLVNGIEPMFHGQFTTPLEPVEYALEFWLLETKALCEVNQQKQREILNLQIREKKLREAIEQIEQASEDIMTVHYARVVLASLYPKEEEEQK